MQTKTPTVDLLPYKRRGIVLRTGVGITDSYGKKYVREIGSRTLRLAIPKKRRR